FNQRSGDRPDHVLKESVAADTKNPCRFSTVPARFEYGPRAVFHLCRRCAERCEVMRTQEITGSAVHCVFIKPVPTRVHISAMKRADDRLSPHVILVSF